MTARALFWISMGVAVAGAGRAHAQCSTTSLESLAIPGGGGISSAVSNDTSFNTFGKSFSFVANGNTLWAFDNATRAYPAAWPGGTTTPTGITFSTAIQNVANPVPLTFVNGATTEAVFVSTLDGRVYAVDARTGLTYWTNVQGMAGHDYFTVVDAGRSNTCKIDVSAGGDGLSAAPVVQLSQFGNADFKKLGRDLVFVITRYGCGTAANRVFAIDAKDGTLVWTFNKFGTYNVNAGLDSCYILYDNTPTVAPANNTLLCGTDQAGSQNSVWALNTLTGAVVWAVPGGRLHGRIQVKSNTTHLYYGTMDDMIHVLSTTDGSNIYTPISISAPVLLPLWPEFRPSNALDMILFTSNDGQFRRVTENTTPMPYLSEELATIGRSNGVTPGTFSSTPAMFPSAGKVYIGESNGSVQQIESALGPTSSNSYASVGNSTAFDGALDFNNFLTSTDIDRLQTADGSGLIKRYCVPWGVDGSWLGISSAQPPAPQPNGGCHAPLIPGDCTCDQDCASLAYAPASKCYQVVCQIRGAATEGTCALHTVANGAACDNSLDGVASDGTGKDDVTGSCNCDPKYAAGGSCSSGCGPNGDGKNCDICVDGVCQGGARASTDALCPKCVNRGDRDGCPVGSTCCGGGSCTDVRNDNANCGACGHACRAQELCKAGSCKRNLNYCDIFPAVNMNVPSFRAQIPGASAIAFFDDAAASGNCPMGIALDQTPGFTLYIDSGGKLQGKWTNSAGATGGASTNGIGFSPDGKWIAAISKATDVDYLDWEKFNIGGGMLKKLATNGHLASQGLPFQDRLFDDGYAANPVFNAAEYTASGSGQVRVYAANNKTPGDVVSYLNGGAGVTLPDFNGITTFITALGFGQRSQVWGNDGFVVAAIGTTLFIDCDMALTNQGKKCSTRVTYPIAVNVADTLAYKNQDVNGNVYTPTIDRIFSIAVDPVNGNIYAEIGGLGPTGGNMNSQIVMLQEADLRFPPTVPGNGYQTVRNVTDVENDQHLNTGLQAVYNDWGGRIAVSPNGILMRIGLAQKGPTVPLSFTQGQVP